MPSEKTWKVEAHIEIILIAIYISRNKKLYGFRYDTVIWIGDVWRIERTNKNKNIKNI
jgi:hypothetical protein